MQHTQKMVLRSLLGQTTALLVALFAARALAQDGLAYPPVIKRFSSLVVENHILKLEPGPANRFSLECSANAQPEPMIRWFLDQQPIGDSDIEGISLAGANKERLEFSSPNLELHEGLYHCEANNSLGLAKSEVIHVTPDNHTYQDWMSPPKFTVQPEVEIQEVDKQAEFSCEADGVPEPKIVWTKNGEVLDKWLDKPVLTIPSIGPTDVGTYACNASNLAGYAYKNVYLNILTQAPSITEKPSDRIVSIGQETIMRCSAKGYPKPVIEWTFKGVAVHNDSESHHISGSGDLTLSQIRADHEGDYECRAENKFGTSSASANLRVVKTTTIVSGPKDTEAQVKMEVSMNCTVLWDPNLELSVLWKKNNINIKIDGQRVSLDSDHRLTIRDLTFADAGTYTCAASTTGTAETATDSGTLTVTGIPPTLINGPTEMTIPEGAEFTELLCTVTGFPMPRHTWFKNSDRVVYDDQVSMDPETGSLKIYGARLQDSAKYVCRADNGYGKPVVASAFVDVRKRSTVIKSPGNLLYKAGAPARFDCLVDVDPRLENSLQAEWFHNGVQLDLEPYLDTNSSAPEARAGMQARHRLMANLSLFIDELEAGDLGVYKCHIQTGIDEVTLEASLYSQDDWNWLVIVIAALACAVVFVVLAAAILCVRRRARNKGRYGVKDVADGKKHNRSEIQYSIDDDTESLHRDSDPDSSRAPIFNPGKSAPADSENSLLNLTDEDMWLRKGMDEDGSFRGRYNMEAV